MPEKRYFLKLTGAFLLGIIALVIAGIIFILIYPYLLVAAFGMFLLLVIFLAIWAAVYIAMVIGVTIYYLFKPMKVSKKKGYSITRAREAGRRQKGATRKKIKS